MVHYSVWEHSVTLKVISAILNYIMSPKNVHLLFLE